ncbi:MAG: hypothetical protein O2807_11385 [bacterium]|nr:hypothetical protein [bacterium]
MRVHRAAENIICGFFFVFAMAALVTGAAGATAVPSPPVAAPTTAPSPPAAAPKAAAKPKKQEPIHITSNRMEAFSKLHFVDFIGDVVATQGEMQIKSDKLRVYFEEKKKDGKKDPKKDTKKYPKKKEYPKEKTAAKPPAAAPENSVERLVATGNVLVNQGKGKFASGENLDYNERTGIAILTGNPKAWEGDNLIIGDKITLFLQEERTVVDGSRSKRVNVTLFPSGEKRPAPAPKK